MEIRENDKAMAGYRRLRLVAGAQAFTLVLYALIVEFLARSGFSPAPLIPDPGLMRAALLLVAVALFFGSGRLRDHMLQPRFDALEQALVPGERLRRMMTACVVAFALCDGVAILGLVFFFVGGGRFDFYLFLLLAAVFMALRFPGAQQWQEWYGRRARLR
jgi:hypothetical protein